ncbi:3'-5' ssDNA/RNA exonuclease TatD, partial [Elysia marginata]
YALKHRQGVEFRQDSTVDLTLFSQDYEGVEAFIENSTDLIGGIGEVGLDFSPRFCKTSEDKESQRHIFSKQVKLAQSHDLAVNVHSRSAGVHAIHLLRELDARKVLLHAFDGRSSLAVEGAARGFYFSVTASICRDPQQLNEPANAVISCEQIAKIKQLDVQHVKQITTTNAVKIFPKLGSLLDTCTHEAKQ